MDYYHLTKVLIRHLRLIRHLDKPPGKPVLYERALFVFQVFQTYKQLDLLLCFLNVEKGGNQQKESVKKGRAKAKAANALDSFG